jgi:outer membrane protein OmpA-like peptidoglycan-associated protein
VQIQVFGAQGGAPVAEAEQDVSDHTPGQPLIVSWPATDDGTPAARIDVKVYDAEGAFTGVRLLPWSVNIPHEEVNFATDSATVTPEEAPKLEKSLALIEEALAKNRALGPIRLFIAGHTDTVGNAAYNVKLSQRRAQAIGAWFRRRGLRIPIAFEGFGESSLLVATPDSTDEARNRRVDYILAIEEPPLRGASWKGIP